MPRLPQGSPSLAPAAAEAQNQEYVRLMVAMAEILSDWQDQRLDAREALSEVEGIMRDIQSVNTVDMTVAKPMLEAHGLGDERRLTMKRIHGELLAAAGRAGPPSIALAPGPTPDVSVVLIGPPGEGKSTLGNLLSVGAGRGDHQPFAAADSFDSAAADAAHADFEQGGLRHRVVDTTGLLGGVAPAVDGLHRISGLAAGGIDVFLFVVRKGRFTDEILTQLSAFEDAAGKGALQRTVVVFSFCGRETGAELAQRCRRTGNASLRQALGRTAAVVGVDSVEARRAAEDRKAVLEAVAGVCRAHDSEPRLVSMDPVVFRRELDEMDTAARGFSGERREAMRTKLESLRSGCASLVAVRSAFAELGQKQRTEDRAQEEDLDLSAGVSRAQKDLELSRLASQSLVNRQVDTPGGPLACCAPTRAKGFCEPCEEGTKQLISAWIEDRHEEIAGKFAEADARADRSQSRGERHGTTAY